MIADILDIAFGSFDQRVQKNGEDNHALGDHWVRNGPQEKRNEQL